MYFKYHKIVCIFFALLKVKKSFLLQINKFFMIKSEKSFLFKLINFSWCTYKVYEKLNQGNTSVHDNSLSEIGGRCRLHGQ